MVDSTKFNLFDLEEILYCINFTYGEADGLADKVKSMIDNYCEYELKGDAIQITHCRKCGKSYE